MLVTKVRGKITTACAGVCGYDAEATIEDENGKVLYAHANDFNDGITFTISETSMYDYLTGQSDDDPDVEFIEQYDGLGESTDSVYHKVFVVLDQVIQLMEGA